MDIPILKNRQEEQEDLKILSPAICFGITTSILSKAPFTSLYYLKSLLVTGLFFLQIKHQDIMRRYFSFEGPAGGTFRFIRP